MATGGVATHTSVAGSLLGSWTMSYDDENRLRSVSYPGGTDSLTYNALGDRVLEENCASGSWIGGRYATESGSYYGTLLQFKRATGDSRFPLYDGIGTVCGRCRNCWATLGSPRPSATPTSRWRTCRPRWLICRPTPAATRRRSGPEERRLYALRS